MIASEKIDEAGNILTRGRDEPLVMTPSANGRSRSAAKIVVLAGIARIQPAWHTSRCESSNPRPLMIDVTGGLEDLPEARLRAPMVEASRLSGHCLAIQVIAHPAAIALALFLTQLRKAGPIRRVVAEIFEPASERGQAGIEELQKQTAGLLSFKPLSKEVYDAQVSFNMLSEYGSDSPHSLERHRAQNRSASGESAGDRRERCPCRRCA